MSRDMPASESDAKVIRDRIDSELPAWIASGTYKPYCSPVLRMPIAPATIAMLRAEYEAAGWVTGDPPSGFYFTIKRRRSPPTIIDLERFEVLARAADAQGRTTAEVAPDEVIAMIVRTASSRRRYAETSTSAGPTPTRRARQ